MDEAQPRLTDRQRDVLRHVADRKTNAQIADELGVSPETVKSHVSEILGELGVDTREEAAEWWRQQRGMRARFAVANRFSRMPALLKLGLGGAGAAAVAGVVIIVALVLFFDGEDEGGAGAAAGGVTRVALTELPEGVDGRSVMHRSALRIVQPVPPVEHNLDGKWTDLEWSPDASVLAGIHVAFEDDGPADTGVLYLMRAPDWELEEVAVPGGTDRRPMGWSPDGTRLAVLAAEGVAIVSGDGEHVATLGGDGLPWRPLTGFAQTFQGSEVAWSADSELLGIVAGGVAETELVTVVTRDGDSVARMDYEELVRPLHDAIADVPEEAVSIAGGGFIDGELVLNAGIAGDELERYTLFGTIAGDTFDWRVEDGWPPEITNDPESQPEWQTAEEAIAGALTDREPIDLVPVAEGVYAAWVGPPSAADEPGEATGLAVYRDGEVELHELEGHAPQGMEAVANGPTNAFDVARVE